VTAEIAAPAKADAKPETPGDANGAATREVPPELVKRVHQLYEDLGREDVRAVQSWDKAHEKGPAEKH
jgi:H+-transporting ATPase